MKRITKQLIALTLTAICIIGIPVTAKAATFSDVSANDWFYTFVTDLTNRSIISGYPDGTFKPQGTITRAEFLSLAVNAYAVAYNDYTTFDAPANTPWYTGIVNRARTLGLVLEPTSITWELSNGSTMNTNTSDNFTGDKLNQPISRQEMALVLSNALYYIVAPENTTAFKDNNDINQFYRAAARKANEAGVLNGYPDGTFQPTNNATRAEAATMINNFLTAVTKRTLKFIKSLYKNQLIIYPLTLYHILFFVKLCKHCSNFPICAILIN